MKAAQDTVVSETAVTGATPPSHPLPAQFNVLYSILQLSFTSTEAEHPQDLSGPASLEAYSTLYTAHTSALERIALLQFIGSSGQALTDAVLDRLVLLDVEDARLAEQVREGRSAVDALRAALLALEAEKVARSEVETTLNSMYRCQNIVCSSI